MKREVFEEFFNKTIRTLAKGICDQHKEFSFTDNFDGLFEEYLTQKTLLKMLVKNMDDSSSEERSRLDRHKVAACITVSIMKTRLLHSNNLDEDNDYSLLEASRMNEQLAFLCGLNVIISYMVKTDPKTSAIKDFKFPPTRYQDESEFIDSIIRGLYYSNASSGFPTLLLSNIFFLLEEYHILNVRGGQT